jgi:hypothetical protein
MQQRATLVTISCLSLVFARAASAEEPSTDAVPTTESNQPKAEQTPEAPPTASPKANTTEQDAETKDTKVELLTTEQAPVAQEPAEVEEEPPPPRVEKGFQEHDGFYLRVAGGLGYLDTKADASGFDYSIRGFAVGFDLMLGGTPVPGLTLGGSYSYVQAPAPAVEANGSSFDPDINFSVWTLGPFVDFYPDPKGGFHAGGNFGFTVASAADNDGDADPTVATGFGGGLFTGYDVWVTGQGSLGAQLKVSLGKVTDTDTKDDLIPKSLVFEVTGLYQ